MRKIPLFFVLLSCQGWSACPLFTYPENHKLDQEVNNICDNILNPVINSETVQSETVKSITISTMVVTSSATHRSSVDMVNNKIINLANGTAAQDAAAFGQLKVIQIKSTAVSTNFNTTSNTFQTANLGLSITPTSASNSILIFVSGTGATQAGNTADLYVTIFRGATNLGSGTGPAFCLIDSAIAGVVNDSVGFNYLDSPATTSCTTYNVKIRNDDNATTVGFGTAGSIQSMTLMEVVSP